MPEIKCPECGNIVDSSLENCPYCNHSLKPKKRGRPKKAPLYKCEKCGEEFNIKSNFCPNCGNPFQKNEEEYLTCSRCGEKMPLNSLYCYHCGNSLQEEVSNTTKPQEQIIHLTEIKEETKPKPLKRPKPKTNNHLFFYISLIIFFTAGCFTAVILSSYLKNKTNDKIDTSPKVYKINRTLSCTNENKEEQNYYFDNDKLVQYSMYSIKDYETSSKAEEEMKNFKEKWENNRETVNVNVQKKETILTKSLIIDLINSHNISLDNDIDINNSYNEIKEKMENNNWTCTEYNKDLGSNLPINEINHED